MGLLQADSSKSHALHPVLTTLAAIEFRKIDCLPFVTTFSAGFSLDNSKPSLSKLEVCRFLSFAIVSVVQTRVHSEQPMHAPLSNVTIAFSSLSVIVIAEVGQTDSQALQLLPMQGSPVIFGKPIRSASNSGQ